MAAVKVEVPGIPRRMPITGTVATPVAGVVTKEGFVDPPTRLLAVTSAGASTPELSIVTFGIRTGMEVEVTNAVTLGPSKVRTVRSLGFVAQHVECGAVIVADPGGLPDADPASTSLYRGTIAGSIPLGGPPM